MCIRDRQPIKSERVWLLQTLAGCQDKRITFCADDRRCGSDWRKRFVEQIQFTLKGAVTYGLSRVLGREANDNVAKFPDVAGKTVAGPELSLIHI